MNGELLFAEYSAALALTPGGIATASVTAVILGIMLYFLFNDDDNSGA